MAEADVPSTGKGTAIHTLTETSRELGRLLDVLPGLVWAGNSDGNAHYFNRRWCDFTGLSATKSHRRGWIAAVHPEYVPHLMEIWQSVASTNHADEQEIRLRRNGGRYFLLTVRVECVDTSGLIVNWCPIHTGIDDAALRSERALPPWWLTKAGRETHFQAVADSLPAMCQVMTATGEIELVNRQTLEYYGLTLEELRRDLTDVVHPDDRELVTAARAPGLPYEFDSRFRRSDGVYRWWHTRLSPLRDLEGRVVLWHCFQIDVDDRKRAEEALDEARAELAHVARVTALGALTASIAHEVSQPLSGVITNASTCQRMLASEPPNVEGAREAVRRIRRDGDRASDVLTHLRGLFSKKGPEFKAVDINEITLEVIALSAAELRRHRVIVQQEFANNLAPIEGDRVQLQQVILNLLLNAKEAMSGVEGRPRQLTIRTSCDNQGHICLSVQDTGVGFDSADAARLFKAFYTTKRKGMGIGLSVSRSIIEVHHGRLWAAPNDGPGATFCFSIPCSATNEDVRQ
jgi:PAS domain S-box-containing protein